MTEIFLKKRKPIIVQRILFIDGAFLNWLVLLVPFLLRFAFWTLRRKIFAGNSLRHRNRDGYPLGFLDENFILVKEILDNKNCTNVSAIFGNIGIRIKIRMSWKAKILQKKKTVF